MQEEDILKGLLDGSIKAYAIKDITGSEESAARIRRLYLKEKFGKELNQISNTIIDYEDAGQRNIENMIGAVHIPLSYVEIKINGEGIQGTHPVYLATTEGRLVAGITRGVSAINASGGASTTIVKEHMTRSITIDSKSAAISKKIRDYINSKANMEYIKSEFSNYTKHGELLGIDTYLIGKRIILVYSAKTKAAMGMNMVTIASNNTTKKLVSRLNENGIKCNILSESGNMCADKKPSSINAIRGRGVSVIAEVVIPKDIVLKKLKAAPKDIVKINYVKNYLGSSLAGSLAHNVHIANALAATFIAYGQDIAQIVDGVVAYDDAEVDSDGNLYISVTLPSLEVGTVGGGTVRETQNELLRSSGVYKDNDETGITKLHLAQLIASVVLAGELNLLAAEATGHLTSAHSSLKR